MIDCPSHLELDVAVERDGQTAMDLLPAATGLPKQRVKLAMTSGAVWLTRGNNTQRLRRAKRLLRKGDLLHIYFDDAILAESPPEPMLVADVGKYSVWNKPYGLRSQGSKWGDHCTVMRWAEQHLEPERPAFTVHRLDRAATGLILIAHSKSMAAALSGLFRKREIDKRYRAVVHGDFSTQAESVEVTEAIDGKDALSEICLDERLDDGRRSIVEVRIHSGRKHQVRRHLASHGFPIVGDRLYGSGETDGVDLQLQANFLAFQCPVAETRVEYSLRS